MVSISELEYSSWKSCSRCTDPNGTSASEVKLALIPVTLSERGFRAVESAKVPGLIEDISRHSLPVHSRMVHTRDKRGDLKETSMPYSSNGDVSIGHTTRRG